jgi:hypothetical protein
MNGSIERHLLSSAVRRGWRIFGGVWAAMVLVLAIRDVGVSRLSHAIPILGLVLLIWLTVALPAILARTVWASDAGIELDSKDGPIVVPWDRVSDPHRFALDGDLRRPAQVLELEVDGRIRRVYFILHKHSAEWIDYLRAGGDDGDD